MAPLFQPLPLIFSPHLYPTEITCVPPLWKPCNLLNYLLTRLYHLLLSNQPHLHHHYHYLTYCLTFTSLSPPKPMHQCKIVLPLLPHATNLRSSTRLPPYPLPLNSPTPLQWGWLTHTCNTCDLSFTPLLLIVVALPPL